MLLLVKMNPIPKDFFQALLAVAVFTVTFKIGFFSCLVSASFRCYQRKYFQLWVVYIAGNWCFTKINQTTNSRIYQGKRTCIDNPFCFAFRRELTICRNRKRIRGTYLQKKKRKKKRKKERKRKKKQNKRNKRYQDGCWKDANQQE